METVLLAPVSHKALTGVCPMPDKMQGMEILQDPMLEDDLPKAQQVEWKIPVEPAFKLTINFLGLPMLLICKYKVKDKDYTNGS